MKTRAFRAVALLLIPTQALLSVPVYADVVATEPEAEASVSPSPPEVQANRTAPQVARPPLYPVFSPAPSEGEIVRARVFGEPLIPFGATTAPENQALASAITAYLRGGNPEATQPLETFLQQHAGSAWRASLLANLGTVYERTGHYGRAERALSEAWQLAKEVDDPGTHAVGDKALGELLDLHMQFGQLESLEGLLDEIGGREAIGRAGQILRQAKGAAWVLRNRHEDAIPSGRVALERVLMRVRPEAPHDPRLDDLHPSMDGASLADLKEVADSAGLRMKMAFRDGEVPIPTLSVIHLKAGHFAALVREENGRYLLDDPFLGGEVWMSRSALAEESSGYFLVPDVALGAGWKNADATAARNVRGKCMVVVPNPLFTGICNLFHSGSGGSSGCNGGSWSCSVGCTGPNRICPTGRMAVYSFHQLVASLHITDSPVGHSPPRGPAVEFQANYNQREATQPQTFYYSNLGDQWSFDWLSYLQDDPANPAAQVDVKWRGGGGETYTGYSGGSYAPERASRAVLVRTSTSPIRYERRLNDGSVEVFDLPDGAATFPRTVFMTKFIDPQGNQLTFTYDSQLRLVSATDAIGQVSTVSYELTSDPLKITKVTDPFGRSAKFDYDGSGRLVRITDVIGIKSEFAYGNGDFIQALTTPYGTTTFTTGAGPSNPTTDFYTQAVDPLGGTERVEYVDSTSTFAATEPAGAVPTGFSQHNANLNRWNGFYWDKRAMALYPGDYTKARISKWLFAGTYKLVDAKHSEKLPLENRVWYFHVGSGGYDWVSPEGRPSRIGRVLDDGSSQIDRYEYNSKGQITRETDPLGREKLYEYDTNNIDLLNVKVKNGAGWDQIASYTYNSQHQPLAATDGANQTTTYTYTASGKVQTVTTPPRAGINEQRTTTYTYESGTDKLLSVTGPGNVTTSYTYDGYGRPRTTTDSDNYTLTYDYDPLDRPTQTTYPDGTYEETQYDKLDPAKRRDRLGRWTQTFYDALRRITATRDPAGRVVTQQWCGCGSLDKLIDPNGNATTWDRDTEGRIIKETRANGSFKQFVYENTTGRLKKTIDAKGQEIQHTNALDGKPIQTSYVNAQIPTPNVSLAYDTTHGRLTSMTDGTGTTNYTYHPYAQLGAGQIASVDGPLANDTITYAYDELGRAVSRTLNGVTSTWSYDQQGRLTSQTDPIGTFGYTYDANSGRTATLTYPNGQTTSYAYFPNSGDHRLQQIHHKQPGGATLNKLDYMYDVTGNIKTWTQQTDTNPAQIYDLEYDPADQLTAATLRTTGVPPQILKRYRYAYDPAGNRTAEQIDDAVTGATHDNMNRLLSNQPGGMLSFRGTLNEPAGVTVQGQPATVSPSNAFTGTAQVPPGTSNVVVTATDPAGNLRTNTYQVSGSGSTRTFTYDNNENQASKVEGGVTTTYEWDAENRLLAVKQGGSPLATFTYDGKGRRATRTAGGVTTNYVYSGGSFLEERPSAGSTKRYVHGPCTDRLLAEVVGATTTYNVADHLGSIARTTDSLGAPTLTREYDPWGNLIQGGAISGFAFTGREWEQDTGLYYYRARYYDPKAGRFVSEDPAGSKVGANLYAYVDGNPIVRVDPSGLFSIKARDPAKISQSTWNTIYNSTREACCKVDTTITDPKLRECIKKSCDTGTVFLRTDCPFGQAGGTVPVTDLWFGLGPIREAKLCVNNWDCLSKAPSGAVAIHEWAHGCGWGEYGGKGVPGNNGRFCE